MPLSLERCESAERKSCWQFTARFIYRCNRIVVAVRVHAYLHFFFPCESAGKIIACTIRTCIIQKINFNVWITCAKVLALESYIECKVLTPIEFYKNDVLKISFCLTKVVEKIWMGLHVYDSSERKSGWRWPLDLHSWSSRKTIISLPHVLFDFLVICWFPPELFFCSGNVLYNSSRRKPDWRFTACVRSNQSDLTSRTERLKHLLQSFDL